MAVVGRLSFADAPLNQAFVTQLKCRSLLLYLRRRNNKPGSDSYLPLAHARRSPGLCLGSMLPPPTCCHGCRTRWGWRSTLWGLSSSRWGWRRILWGLKSWSWNRKHHCHAATYTADFSASHQNLFRKVHSFSLSFFLRLSLTISVKPKSTSRNKVFK